MEFSKSKLEPALLIDQHFKDVKTGDLAIMSRTNLTGLFMSLTLQSQYHHTGIYIWISAPCYHKSGQVKVISAYQDGAILGVLHQNKKRVFNLLTKTRMRDLALEPISDVTKMYRIFYCRSLASNLDRDGIVAKTQDLLRNFRKYKYAYDLRTSLGVVIGSAIGPTYGFTCSHFTLVYYIQVVGYPCGEAVCNSDLQYQKDTLILPNREDVLFRPSDFSYESNSAPIFEDIPEWIVYSMVDPVDIVLLNYITIGIIVILIVVVMIAFLVPWYGAAGTSTDCSLGIIV